MSTVLKTKYNSTGIRCVDACLQYGELRFISNDGTPTKIELPLDKYDDAILEFEERINEGLTSNNIRPEDILRKGSVTYNQAKKFAEEGKIRGINHYPIDGSIECDNILGISGVVEYALARWEGLDKAEAVKKGVLRAIKVNGEDFVRSMNFGNDIDINQCYMLAKSAKSIDNIMDIKLYQPKHFNIGTKIYNSVNEKNRKYSGFDIKDLSNLESKDIIVGILGALLSFALIQIVTNFGALLGNNTIYFIISAILSTIGGIISIAIFKNASSKNNNFSGQDIINMFDEELDKAVYENLLTYKEMQLILENITQGDLSKILVDMRGSVNKRASVNIIMEKQTRFILDARSTISLPSTDEIKQIFINMVNQYQGKLDINYDIKKVTKESAE